MFVWLVWYGQSAKKQEEKQAEKQAMVQQPLAREVESSKCHDLGHSTAIYHHPTADQIPIPMVMLALLTAALSDGVLHP